MVTMTWKHTSQGCNRAIMGAILTVTIAETMVMMTLAMAEIIALMAPPIAETMDPYRAKVRVVI